MSISVSATHRNTTKLVRSNLQEGVHRRRWMLNSFGFRGSKFGVRSGTSETTRHTAWWKSNKYRDTPSGLPELWLHYSACSELSHDKRVPSPIKSRVAVWRARSLEGHRLGFGTVLGGFPDFNAMQLALGKIQQFCNPLAQLGARGLLQAALVISWWCA